MFKVDNKRRRFGVFIVQYEPFSIVSILYFEQVNVSALNDFWNAVKVYNKDTQKMLIAVFQVTSLLSMGTVGTKFNTIT